KVAEVTQNPDWVQARICLLKDAVARRTAEFGEGDPRTLASMNNRAIAYDMTGKQDQALPIYLKLATDAEKRRFPDANAVLNLIDFYERQRQFDRAEEWLRKWLAVKKDSPDAGHPAHEDGLAILGSNLLQQKKWVDAQSVLRECLAIREKKSPD